MNCADIQVALPELMETAQASEVQAHLKSCPECTDLVSDLELIAHEARQLAATDEPALRVWVKIAAELRAEGIIREPDTRSSRPVLLPSTKRRWNAWWLVPVAATLLAGGSYLLRPTPSANVAVQTTPATTATPPTQVATATPHEANPPSAKAAVQKAPKATDQDDLASNAPMTPVSTQDRQFLNEVGQRSPEMRATYESQLRGVNAFVRDAEAYVKQNPGDEDARQQLMDAYQQKEMLYQMALDHVQ